MEIEEYLKFRTELLDRSKDEDGFVTENLLLTEVMPSLLDAKQVDSEEISSSYNISTSDNLKINAYQINESGERLQIFLIDEKSIDLTKKHGDLLISQKSIYENQFKRAIRFVNKAIKGHLNENLQDSDPSRPLISHLSSSAGAHEFDVIEVFLISTTATVSLMTTTPSPKRLEFDDEELKVNYTLNKVKTSKEILIKKRLIDLNFLFNVFVSEGNREALIVDFESNFGNKIEAIRAADESKFESYLCVLPGEVIAGLYKNYSSRLLEKNVRSFLQFRGVNQGIRDTIRKEPEKFIAYNNGLTITATEGQIVKESGKIFIKSLKDFQIVNGGQTTATIYFSRKDGFDVSKVNVMAKINIAKESTSDELEELISNISTYSNAQSRVSKVDLRSRNPQLVQLKSMSESVVTPSGTKWFFERAKGEFSTKLRIAGSRKLVIQKDYPSDKRFSKEQLAKYYIAWGDQPYMVKKGGEKVFRQFIEEITGVGPKQKPIAIDRTFYEGLIAKIILFRKLEKIYGQGKNSMGQIRSAVIPYCISILYVHTDGNKKNQPFDLIKIWKSEKLDDDLMIYLTELLMLVNTLIKKYAKSDDLGEYSKKPELWNDLISSTEVKNFLSSENSITIFSKYTISQKEMAARLKSRKKSLTVDFSLISQNSLVHGNGKLFYKKISSLFSENLTSNEDRKLSGIITSIEQYNNLDEDTLNFEKELVNKIRSVKPEILDQLPKEKDFRLSDTLDYIIRKFNTIIEENKNLESEFEKIEMIAAAKGLKYTGVIKVIAKQLSKEEPPKISQLNHASYCILNKTKTKEADLTPKGDLTITELNLRKMVIWASNENVLSNKERDYITNFAYHGYHKINDFHASNLKRHLKTLIKAGFTG
jgi:AIPR protein/abortive infection phage resistance-like protein